MENLEKSYHKKEVTMYVPKNDIAKSKNTLYGSIHWSNIAGGNSQAMYNPHVQAR